MERLSASALSPDGRRLAVGAELVRIRCPFSTQPQAARSHSIDSAHASPIAAIAFSGDGTKLATADAEGTIKIWADAQKLNSKSAALLDAQGPSRGDQHCRFFERWQAARQRQRRQDGQSLGSGECRRGNPATGTVCRRWVARGTLFARWATDRRRHRQQRASVGRRHGATRAGTVGRRQGSSLQRGVLADRQPPAGCRATADAADVSYVALWDIDAGTELARLPGATDLPDFRVDEYTGAVGALAFSPDGKYLVAGFGSSRSIDQ